MSQAENLLDSLTVDDITPYTAEPQTEGHIVIGKDRFITVPESLKRIAVQHDHNIETVTFECPRYWDENDLSKMKIYINYMRPNKSKGSYIAKNVVVEDDLMYFDWTVEGHVTEFKGQLSFLVCAMETDEEGLETLHWNTELNNEMYVSEGLECEGEVISQNQSIITDLLLRMDTVEEINIKASDMEALASEVATDAFNANEAARTAIENASMFSDVFDTDYSENRLSNLYTGMMDSQGAMYSTSEGSHTNYIPVTEGEKIYVSARNSYDGSGPFNQYIKNVTAFDSNKEILPDVGSDLNLAYYKVPRGVSYIIITLMPKPDSLIDVFVGTNVPAIDNDVEYEPYHEPIHTLKPSVIPYVSDNHANAIKGNANGTVVKIDDISPVEHNVSVKVLGKNLIPFPYANPTVTRDGITFTVNDDRSITVDGTATAATTFVIANPTSGIDFEHGVTYTLSGKGGNISVAMAYKIADGTTKYQTNGGSVTWGDSYTFIHIYYSIPSGATYEGLILPAPQLERGTVATDYVPYVDIENINVISSRKNLAPYPYTEDGTTRAGVTYTTTEDGVIHANGTSTGSYMNVVSTDEKILYLHKGVTYRFSCAPTGGEGSKYYAYVKDASKTNYFDYGNGVTFTPSASGYGAITIVVSTDMVATDLMFKPQLEVGDGSVDFEVGGAVVKYSPDKNGEVTVRSISPTTMIFADAEGATVECEYNRDTSKLIGDMEKDLSNANAAMEELSNKIKPAETYDFSNAMTMGGSLRRSIPSETQVGDTFTFFIPAGWYMNTRVFYVDGTAHNETISATNTDEVYKFVIEKELGGGSFFDAWKNGESIEPKDCKITFKREHDRIGNIEKEIGDIDTALDELHSYAQALITGGGA